MNFEWISEGFGGGFGKVLCRFCACFGEVLGVVWGAWSGKRKKRKICNLLISLDSPASPDPPGPEKLEKMEKIDLIKNFWKLST